MTGGPPVAGSCWVTLQQARPSTVGFFSGCTWHEYRQLAFKFDFSALHGHSLPPVEAVLRYREVLYHEQAPNGGRASHAGEFQISCWLRLRRPTVDWDRGNPAYAIP